VVEQGTHQSLLAAQGEHTRLLAAQSVACQVTDSPTRSSTATSLAPPGLGRHDQDCGDPIASQAAVRDRTPCRFT
jgi:hypothetical protein